MTRCSFVKSNKLELFHATYVTFQINLLDIVTPSSKSDNLKICVNNLTCKIKVTLLKYLPLYSHSLNTHCWASMCLYSNEQHWPDKCSDCTMIGIYVIIRSAAVMGGMPAWTNDLKHFNRSQHSRLCVT